MNCGCSAIIDLGTHVKFVTAVDYVVAEFPLGPRRAEMREKVANAICDGRVEVRCNRDDEHAVDGKHWFRNGAVSIEWTVGAGPYLASDSPLHPA